MKELKASIKITVLSTNKGNATIVMDMEKYTTKTEIKFFIKYRNNKLGKML